MQLLISLGFVATVLAVAVAIVALVARTSRRAAAVTAAAIAGWLAITAALARAGVIAFDGGPPRALLLPWIVVVATAIALWRPAGRAVLAAIPRPAVIGLQVFRVPVELVLWGLFSAGALPERLTFSGRNFDILVGLTAIPVALLARDRRALAIAWHVGGLLLLANIVIMAMRAQPPIVTTVPFVWLPGCLVPVALLGHGVGLIQACVLSGTLVPTYHERM
jgi:hypothetical protein